MANHANEPTLTLRTIERTGDDLRLAGVLDFPERLPDDRAVTLRRTSALESGRGTWTVAAEPAGLARLALDVTVPVTDELQLAGAAYTLLVGGHEVPVTAGADPAPADLLLSVVVPAHDVGEWIEECLESIDRQGVGSLEVLVVDDRSADDTRAVVERSAERFPFVRLVESPRPGGGSARNAGIAAARGRYLVFADGDDLVPDGAYRRMLDVLSVTGSDLVVGDYLKFDNHRTWGVTKRLGLFDGDAFAARLEDVPTAIGTRACWNKVFRRDFWDGARIAFPDVMRSNDVVPMTSAYLAARRVDVVARPVYLYRERPGGTSMTARSSAGTGLLSYLEQEHECLRRVERDGGPGVRREYARMVLESDLWTHLVRHLEAAHAQPGDDGGARDAFRALWEALDADERDAMGPAKHAVVRDFLDGDPGLAALPAGVVAALGRARSVLPLEDVRVAAGVLAARHASDAGLATALVSGLLLPSVEATLADEDAEPAAARALVRDVLASFGPGLALAGLSEKVRHKLALLVSGADDAEVVAAFASGTLERGRSMAAPDDAALVQRLELDGRRLVVEGVLDVSWPEGRFVRGDLRLHYRTGRYLHAQRLEVEPLAGAPGHVRWSAQVPLDVVTRRGRWTLALDLAVTGGVHHLVHPVASDSVAPASATVGSGETARVVTVVTTADRVALEVDVPAEPDAEPSGWRQRLRSRSR